MWLEGGKARGKSEASVGSGSFRGSKGGAGGFEKPACPKFLIGRVKETAIRNIRCEFSSIEIPSDFHARFFQRKKKSIRYPRINKQLNSIFLLYTAKIRFEAHRNLKIKKDGKI